MYIIIYKFLYTIVTNIYNNSKTYDATSRPSFNKKPSVVNMFVLRF